MADTPKKCKHIPCNCLAAEDSDYCGAYCEGAKDNTEVICDCGHPGCEVETR